MDPHILWLIQWFVKLRMQQIQIEVAKSALLYDFFGGQEVLPIWSFIERTQDVSVMYSCIIN